MRIVSVFFCISILGQVGLAQQWQMTIHNKAGTSIFPVSSIGSIKFTGIITDVAQDQASAIIRSFALRQNYPNPFNPSTTIQYEVLTPGDVAIRIYNSLGQLVNGIDEYYTSPGEQSYVWNGTDFSGRSVASGVYFYTVSSGKSVQTKKMLLIK